MGNLLNNNTSSSSNFETSSSLLNLFQTLQYVLPHQWGDVWHCGMGVTTQPQNPGFEPQFRHKCWANPAVPAAISKVAAVVCCCSNGWS